MELNQGMYGLLVICRLTSSEKQETIFCLRSVCLFVGCDSRPLLYRPGLEIVVI